MFEDGDPLEARLRATGVVPVVALDRATDALPMAEGLLAAGLPVVEVTFRTAAAAEAITLLRRHHPDLLVGAGTILTVDQVEAALAAGAAFLVSPGLNPAVVERTAERGGRIIPGVATPSEIEAALVRGIDLVKLFPATVVGGPAFLRAVAGPYPTVRFIPTGGITAATLGDYLALPSVVACGGSWICPPDALAARDAATIERLAREALGLVRTARTRATTAAEAMAPPLP